MINTFLAYLKFERRASEHTIKAYQTDLLQFEKYLFFQYELSDVSVAQTVMLRSWIVSLMEEGVQPVSINRKIASLRGLYSHLRKRGVISKDPSKPLSVLKSKKKLPSFVEEKAVNRLFEEIGFTDDFAGLRDRTVMELLYGCGIRLSELLGLEVKDINVYQETIRVWGKRSKERIIPISPILRHLLVQYISERAAEEGVDNLIVTNSGKPAYPVFIQRLVKRYLEAVTTLSQKSPHILRHTFATHLLNRGAEIGAIKDLLGHASLAATQIYTHNSIDKLKKTHEQAHPKA